REWLQTAGPSAAGRGSTRARCRGEAWSRDRSRRRASRCWCRSGESWTHRSGWSFDVAAADPALQADIVKKHRLGLQAARIQGAGDLESPERLGKEQERAAAAGSEQPSALAPRRHCQIVDRVEVRVPDVPAELLF